MLTASEEINDERSAASSSSPRAERQINGFATDGSAGFAANINGHEDISPEHVPTQHRDVFVVLVGATVAPEVAGMALVGLSGAAAAKATPPAPIKRWWVASPKASHIASTATRRPALTGITLLAGIRGSRRLRRVRSEPTPIGGCCSIIHLTSALLAG